MLDSNGDLQINEDGSVDYDSVLIRNNPKYLLPKTLKFILPKLRTSHTISRKCTDNNRRKKKKKKLTGIGLEPDSPNFENVFTVNSIDERKFC